MASSNLDREANQRAGPLDGAALANLQTVAERERALLAPYASFSSQTRGRRYSESEHPYRGPFQRDRDRIVHSAAYRRLSGKTQVFTGEMGDYHRTRLTHTYEVASIARTLGRALRLNEDLIEALALFHDIGHPPFGHAGEDALAECLQAEGGFSHNQYALTLAEELETRYPTFPGLNLTWEVLGGQSHRAHKTSPAIETPSLEVQVVDLADSITYDAHDTDDAVKLGLVTLDEIREVPLVRQAADRVHEQFGLLTGKLLRNAIVHELIDLQVSDVLTLAGPQLRAQATAQALQHASVAATGPRAMSQASAAANQPGIDPLGPSPALAAQKRTLERYLYDHVYRHPTLLTVRSLAQNRLHFMFRTLTNHPQRLPARFLERARQVGLPRSIGDYLAGMTDRFCDAEYHRLCELGSESIEPL